MKKLLISVISLLVALATCISCTPPAPAEVAPTDSFINGVELSKYAIVYSEDDYDYSRRAAEYIKSEILARTGLDLPLIDDKAERVSDYEIVVGETSRGISTRLNAHTGASQFAILAENTQIALEGDYFVIAAAAYFFIETYVPEDNFDAHIPQEVTVHDPIVKEAKNFILLIGDGMGLYQTLLFDKMEDNSGFSDGEDRFYGYYLPYHGYARTSSLTGVTDSAAAATALACGYKTKNGYVGQDASHKTLQSITELAASLGKSTAVMSTEASTGATPSAFTAHADSRDNTDEILDDQSALTDEYGTIIRCDYDYYTKKHIGSLEDDINLTLDELDDNENGFFLMFEEAYVDKHCDDNNYDYTFRTILRFNQVIATFMEYAYYNPETLVIITADHETGTLLPKATGDLGFNGTAHTSHYVPVFAYGAGAELFDGIVVENIQIPQTLAAFMGEDDFGDQSKHQSLTK